MFPVTDKYIIEIYIDKNTGNPVTVDYQTERKLLVNAKNTLKAVIRGYGNPVFSDILRTRADLIAEIVFKGGCSNDL
jgi:hypothetical protein